MMARKTRGRLLERARTDDSLRTERKNIDDARKGARASAERDADGVVDRARAVADAVLSASRLKADHESLRPRPAEAGAVVGERARADLAVRGERATADVALRSDRKDRADALDALLVHEREATDAYLLTERARSDDAVAHRDDFLGMVAHDVRNLLNAIVLNLELLRPAGGDDEPGLQGSAAANRIRRNVARMNRLIGDLVDVTSIDAGKLATSPIEGDAAALVAEAAETFQPAALEKGVSLSVEVPAGPLLAEFDHDRMLQVLANLIANAIKFTPCGGKISVRVEAGRGTLRFCASDTGVGIPAPMLAAIFERFWQVGENDRRGQGLGLYISKCIVEAHRGRIWAESKAGKGSQLYFTLPVPSSQRRGSPTRGAARDEARPARRREGRADRRRRS
jgi:signal transduction histidine kinase